MRLTVVASSYPRYAGDVAAPFVQSICEHLAQLGHTVEVVAPYDQLVRPTTATIKVHRYRYAPLDGWHIMGHARSLAGDMRFRGSVFLLLPFFFLIGFLRTLWVAYRQHTDLIYAHWVLPGGLVGACVAAVLRVPLAISLHGSDVFVARRNALLGRVAGWVFRRASVITACSPELAEAALELGAAPERLHLMAWGADPNRFRPEIIPMTRTELGASEGDVLLIALGRLVPKKGFTTLVRCLPDLIAIEPRVRLVIGGEGPQRHELHHLASSLGVSDRLSLPGQISWDRVPEFLAAGDIFVLPSVRDSAGNLDGLPTVLLEAMATGLPVVASNIGGVPLVIEDGVNGLICPAGDTLALSQALGRLLNTDASQLGQAARRSVVEHFNWTVVAQRLSDLFTEAVRTRKVGKL